MEAQTRTASDFHPLLRGGRKTTYSHGYTPSQMQSLSAICETLIPSLSTETIPIHAGRENPPSKAIQSFYLASGAENSVPDEVAELIVKRGSKEAVFLVGWVCWLLGTRLGTLLLCGFASFCRDFPFVKKFSEISVEKREQILIKWSRACGFSNLFRLVFLITKSSCFFVFFSLVWFLPAII